MRPSDVRKRFICRCGARPGRAKWKTTPVNPKPSCSWRLFRWFAALEPGDFLFQQFQVFVAVFLGWFDVLAQFRAFAFAQTELIPGHHHGKFGTEVPGFLPGFAEGSAVSSPLCRDPLLRLVRLFCEHALGGYPRRLDVLFIRPLSGP